MAEQFSREMIAALEADGEKLRQMTGEDHGPVWIEDTEVMMQPIPQKDIQDWLRYWQATKSVAVHNINSFDQVAEARKYCSCMREGVFSEVTDLQIWRALCNMRDGRYSEVPR